MTRVRRSLIVSTMSAALVLSALGAASAGPLAPLPFAASTATDSPVVLVQTRKRDRGIDPGAVIAGAALLGILGIAAANANRAPQQPGYGAGYPAYGSGAPDYDYDLGANDRNAMRSAASQCVAGSKRHYRREFGAVSEREQITRAVYAGGSTWQMYGTAQVSGPYGRQQVGFVCVVRGNRIIDFQ